MNTTAESPVIPVRPKNVPARPRTAWWKPAAGLLVGALAAAWLGRMALHAYRYETTDDAYVSGHLHQISPQLDAQVKAVFFTDNQAVKAGDVLVQLDPLQFELARQKAVAQLAQAHAQAAETRAAVEQSAAQVAEARARVTQAESQLNQTATALDLARLTLGRAEKLVDQGGMNQSELDSARSAVAAAEAAHAANQANIVAAKSAVGSAEAARNSTQAQIAAAEANVAVAEALVRDAERQLGYTTIVAPDNGRVGNKAVEVGNRVVAGQTLCALAAPDSWIVANFKETQLARMRAGQPVELAVDALPGRALHGTVDSIAPASGAQFALLPPDNATGNFNKVVQRVPVKIILDEASRLALADHVRLGLSVIVDVRIR